MSRRSRRKTAKPPTQPAGDQRRLGRHAAFWLATLSTVVGVATGMFTLRDQIFPREAGSANAVSGPVYQQQVGEICDDVNEDDRRRAREIKTVRRELRRAKTSLAQRNALLDAQRRTIARSSHALAALDALEAPKELTAAQRKAEAAWNLNLARLTAYASRLDRAGKRAELFAALDFLSRLRPQLAKTGVTVMSGLKRLGGNSCDLQPPIVTAAFTLPALHHTTHHHGSSGTTDAGTGGNQGTDAGSGGSTSGNEAATAGDSTGAGTGGSTGANDVPPSGNVGTPNSTGGGASGDGGGGAGGG